jgi:hypothetical protein
MRQPPRPHRRFAPLLAVTAGLALTLAALPGVAGAVAGGPHAAAVRADEVTVSQDDLRTGWDPTETAMTPADVATFGQLFSTAVNGQVYAQPLVVGSTVIVATETDFVYGLDATTGAVLWQISLGTPYHITSCTDLTPDVGVTGTPVYDPPAAGTTGDGTVYVVAQTMTKKTPGYGLFGIDPVTGAITENVPIGGKPANDSHITFKAAMQLERPGLLLMNGWVYSAFGSHCDHQPYAGFVSGVNVATKKTTLWTDESGVSDNEAGIWHGGGGVMSDGPGRIFVTSGNGISPAAGKGTSPPGQLAESVIRLAVGTTGALTAQDFYSPDDAPALDAADRDFGAGGPVGLPFGTSGTTSYPDLLAQAGKDGRIFLLNRDNLGGRKQGGALSITTPYGGEWGHPAVFADTSTLTAANAATANNYLYFVGKSDPLRVFKFEVSAAGVPTLSDVANSSLVFGYTSGSPTVTSDGTDATTAVVWDTYVPNATGANAELEAYDVSSGALAACSSTAPCSLSPIFSAPIGTAAKFTVPATSNGRVYVGTRDGHVYGFGAPPAAAPVTGTTASFGHTGVNSAISKTVSITAAKTVTVTGVTATTGASNAVTPASQFTVGKVTETAKGSAAPVPVKLPVVLAKGDKLNAAVTFTPAAPGGTDGTLSFTTKSATFPTLAVPLAGDGTQTGLEAQPTTIAFPLAPDQGITDVPVGTAVPQVADITNYGTTADTVTSVTAPSGPFTAIGLPGVGTKILPGRSIPVQVTFAPTGAGPASGSFTVDGTNGSSATVTLSAVGTAAVSQLTAAKPVVNFGTIPVAKKTTVYVDVTNSGNTLATVTGTGALPSPFAAPIRPEKDLPFNPSYDLTLPVTFTPTKAGTFTANYKLTWSDLKGTHTLEVVLTGKAT